MSSLIWLLINEQNLIIDIAEAITAPQGYIQYYFGAYPNDIATRTYRFIDGEIVRDETLYAAYIATLEEQQEQGGAE